jgi:hypothetical protein
MFSAGNAALLSNVGVNYLIPKCVLNFFELEHNFKFPVWHNL